MDKKREINVVLYRKSQMMAFNIMPSDHTIEEYTSLRSILYLAMEWGLKANGYKISKFSIKKECVNG